MSHALRQRIDATEAFAADVTHELKNPIASLRSAREALGTIEAADRRAQLMEIANDDVRRLDRLGTDIAEASRVDAQLSRAKFDAVDLGHTIERLVVAREARNIPNDIRIAFARPRRGVAVVMGDEQGLLRVIENLVDNAVSFSPPAVWSRSSPRALTTMCSSALRMKVRASPKPSASRSFRSEEHTSALQSLIRNSYAVF